MKPSLSRDAHKRFESLLARGEVVRWSGGPEDPDRGLTQRLGTMGPAGFGAAMLVIAGTLAVLRSAGDHAADHTPLSMALLGGFVLLFGLVRIAQQARDRARARGRFYAVTNRRLIAVDGSAVLVILPDALRGLMPLEGPGGTGDLLVFYRADALDTRAEEATLVLHDVAALDRAREAVELLARKHGVDLSDEADDAA